LRYEIVHCKTRFSARAFAEPVLQTRIHERE